MVASTVLIVEVKWIDLGSILENDKLDVKMKENKILGKDSNSLFFENRIISSSFTVFIVIVNSSLFVTSISKCLMLLQKVLLIFAYRSCCNGLIVLIVFLLIIWDFLVND